MIRLILSIIDKLAGAGLTLFYGLALGLALGAFIGVNP